MTFTAQQPDLFAPRTRRDRFDVWIETDKGQACLRAFIAYARNLIADGHEHLGARMIVEDLRHKSRTTADPDGIGFKIDDRLTPALVRQAIKQAPDLAGRFTLKNMGG